MLVTGSTPDIPVRKCCLGSLSPGDRDQRRRASVHCGPAPVRTELTAPAGKGRRGDAPRGPWRGGPRGHPAGSRLCGGAVLRAAGLGGRLPTAGAGGKFALFRSSDPLLAVLGRGRSRAWAPGRATPWGRALVPAARFPLRRLARRDLGARRPRGPPLRSAWAPAAPTEPRLGAEPGHRPQSGERGRGPRLSSLSHPARRPGSAQRPVSRSRPLPICQARLPCAPGSAPPPPSGLLLSLWWGAPSPARFYTRRRDV